METLNLCINNKANFVELTKNTMIKGQSIWNRETFYLVGTDLITVTSKYTHSQKGCGHSANGSTTRFRLNGKAIAAAALNEFIKSHTSTVVLYSRNVYELKAVRAKLV